MKRTPKPTPRQLAARKGAETRRRNREAAEAAHAAQLARRRERAAERKAEALAAEKARIAAERAARRAAAREAAAREAAAAALAQVKAEAREALNAARRARRAQDAQIAEARAEAPSWQAAVEAAETRTAAANAEAAARTLRPPKARKKGLYVGLRDASEKLRDALARETLAKDDAARAPDDAKLRRKARDATRAVERSRKRVDAIRGREPPDPAKVAKAAEARVRARSALEVMLESAGLHSAGVRSAANDNGSGSGVTRVVLEGSPRETIQRISEGLTVPPGGTVRIRVLFGDSDAAQKHRAAKYGGGGGGGGGGIAHTGGGGSGGGVAIESIYDDSEGESYIDSGEYEYAVDCAVAASEIAERVEEAGYEIHGFDVWVSDG